MSRTVRVRFVFVLRLLNTCCVRCHVTQAKLYSFACVDFLGWRQFIGSSRRTPGDRMPHIHLVTPQGHEGLVGLICRWMGEGAHAAPRAGAVSAQRTSRCRCSFLTPVHPQPAPQAAPQPVHACMPAAGTMLYQHVRSFTVFGFTVMHMNIYGHPGARLSSSSAEI